MVAKKKAKKAAKPVKPVKKTVKKAAKKTSKKSVKKATRKPVKKAVKKTTKKVSRKVSKKAVKKPTKKTAGKKQTRKKKAEFVEICSACNSPDLRADLINNQLIYTCQRCGYRSPDALKVKKSEAIKILKKRRDQLRAYHLANRNKHRKLLYRHVENYQLRSWFEFISLVIVILGLILLTSDKSPTGFMFVIIGVVGLYTGEKL